MTDAERIAELERGLAESRMQIAELSDALDNLTAAFLSMVVDDDEDGDYEPPRPDLRVVN